jgi:hypothetical protein
LQSNIKEKLDIYVRSLEKTDLYSAANRLRSRIDRKLEGYVIAISPTNKRWRQILTLASGVLFLLDLLCIVWWYARYIYRVQPKAQFGTYFLDFVICSMFALAANSWTKPNAFLFATICATTFLICRFLLLYFSSSASQTDRYILKMAGIGLSFSVPLAITCLYAAGKHIEETTGIEIFGPGLPGLLSLIGIVLTIRLKTKIDVAVAIYTARHTQIARAHLTWPKSLLPGTGIDIVEEQHARIRHRTRNGLSDFDNLFWLFKKHDRIYSRVHSETELRVQSYILSLPSCEKEDYAEEIEKKAFMAAVSHWLDDLVDGRNELLVYEQLQEHKRLHSDPPLSDDEKLSKKLFSKIYRPLITKHTDRHFYDRLCHKISESCLLPYNHKYMLLGLNRVACGAVIFSPKLTPEQRWDVLTDHNNFLKLWNIEGPGKDFENAVEDLIDAISVGDEAGPVLLGLTTKTVQEIALSSERRELNVGLSILLSILYAPLIYYHDIEEELENDEMVQLQAFDTDSDLWIPWLEEAYKIVKTYGQQEDQQLKKKIDEHHEMRLKQIEMAYKCFEPKLPEHIRSRLSKIYIPENSEQGDTKQPMNVGAEAQDST